MAGDLGSPARDACRAGLRRSPPSPHPPPPPWAPVPWTEVLSEAGVPQGDGCGVGRTFQQSLMTAIVRCEQPVGACADAQDACAGYSSEEATSSASSTILRAGPLGTDACAEISEVCVNTDGGTSGAGGSGGDSDVGGAFCERPPSCVGAIREWDGRQRTPRASARWQPAQALGRGPLCELLPSQVDAGVLGAKPDRTSGEFQGGDKDMGLDSLPLRELRQRAFALSQRLLLRWRQAWRASALRSGGISINIAG